MGVPIAHQITLVRQQVRCRMIALMQWIKIAGAIEIQLDSLENGPLINQGAERSKGSLGPLHLPLFRRRFLGLLGAGFMWPPATGAQDRGIPVIGFLSAGSSHTFARFLEAFQQGLREQGFVEGRNVAIDYRWAEGHMDELDALATELVADRVALIAATGGLRSAQAAKKATASIPIVFVLGAATS
jgi:hypothetical protein